MLFLVPLQKLLISEHFLSYFMINYMEQGRIYTYKSQLKVWRGSRSSSVPAPPETGANGTWAKRKYLVRSENFPALPKEVPTHGTGSGVMG